MAIILGRVTINNKDYLEVDGNPASGAGTNAPLGDLAVYDDGTTSYMYMKIGTADTAWDRIPTVSTGNVLLGQHLYVPVYFNTPNGYQLSDSVTQNSHKLQMAYVAQGTRTTDIVYSIPNPGDGVSAASFVLTEGAQTINGVKTFGNDVIVNGNFTVNGTLTYINSTVTQITDPLLTLNKGGVAGSGSGVGFEIEENALITGYWKTAADRLGWVSLVPASSFVLNLDQSLLTANRKQSFANTDGTFVMRASGTPGVATQLAFWSDANNVAPATGLTWNSGTSTLTIPNVIISTFTLGSVIFAGTGGQLSQDNAKFFYDVTNHRLGLNTTSPARLLDVSGASVFRGALLINDSTSSNAKEEYTQYQVSTTDAAVTALATIAVPANSEMVIESRVNARRTGGTAGTAGDGAAYVRTVRVKNVSGVVTAMPVQADYTSEDQKKWDATYVVSGTNIVLNINGDTNNNVSWTATCMVNTLS